MCNDVQQKICDKCKGIGFLDINYEQGKEEPNPCCDAFMRLRKWGVIEWNGLYKMFSMSSIIKNKDGHGRCFGGVKFCPFCGNKIN